MTRKTLYLAELIFNLNRFVDDSITSKPTEIVHEIPPGVFISQGITGDYTALSALYAEPDVLTRFAAQYSKMELEGYDGIVNELAADFLNLHNGLFLVNLSETENVESTLTPPLSDDKDGPLKALSDTYIMPVEFKFGTVNFVLSEK
ncbi:MAG: hypothetical protein K6A90_15265 [Lachnospiraceae bacterium]|nr:hypothetical protein [Lachnospiraceae bacterium]